MWGMRKNILCCAWQRQDCLVEMQWRMTSRYDSENRCQSKMIKSTEIETIVWQDIERWLRNPGEILNELNVENDRSKAAAVREAEITILRKRLSDLELEKKGILSTKCPGVVKRSRFTRICQRVK